MKQLEQAVKILKQGGIVVYPTDTAYGLAVDATNAAAVKKLYRLKGRSFHNPIHVIPPSKNWIEKLVRLNPAAKLLIEEFLPGPLTLVLPLKISGPSWKLLSAGTKTLGIRRPKNKLALDLASGLGKPITTTSANLSGQANCYSIDMVKRQFQGNMYFNIYYLNGGTLKKTKPSTVISLVGHVKIMRPGPISERKIKNALFRPSNQHRS